MAGKEALKRGLIGLVHPLQQLAEREVGRDHRSLLLRRTTRISCRAGSIERGVARLHCAGPVKCSTSLAAVPREDVEARSVTLTCLFDYSRLEYTGPLYDYFFSRFKVTNKSILPSGAANSAGRVSMPGALEHQRKVSPLIS